MKTLICLENMSYSALNTEIIEEVNHHVVNSIDEVCLTSFDETLPFADVNTAIFKINELDSFHDGIIVSNKISHAMSILGCANNSKKVLYLYDLDWMFEPMLYNDIYDVLNNRDLVLILRSNDHISPVKNLCNREPDAIMQKFNLEKIWNSL